MNKFPFQRLFFLGDKAKLNAKETRLLNKASSCLPHFMQYNLFYFIARILDMRWYVLIVDSTATAENDLSLLKPRDNFNSQFCCQRTLK